MSKSMDFAGTAMEVIGLVILGCVGVVVGHQVLAPVEAVHKAMNAPDPDPGARGRRFGDLVSRRTCVREEHSLLPSYDRCPDRPKILSTDGLNATKLLTPAENPSANAFDADLSTRYCVASKDSSVTATFNVPVTASWLRVTQTRYDPKKRPTSLVKRAKVVWDGGEGEVLFDAKPIGTGDVAGEIHINARVTRVTVSPIELATVFPYYAICFSKIEVVGKRDPNEAVLPEATALLGLGF